MMAITLAAAAPARSLELMAGAWLAHWQVDTQALLLTLRLASVTTVILLAITVPMASWLTLGSIPAPRRGWLSSMSSGGWRIAWGGYLRALVETIAMLPLVLPPTVLGFYLLVLLGPQTGLGRLLIRMIGHPLAFSFDGLVVGSVLYSLPFALQPLTAGFSQVRPELLEASALLGAGRLRTLCAVVLPLSRRSLLAAAVLSFTHTVGEFGVVLMLGGDIPGSTRTLSIALLDQVQDANYAGANQTALLLLAGSALVLLLVYAGRKAGVEAGPDGPDRGLPGTGLSRLLQNWRSGAAEGTK
jgi:molybdate transport system permease protein